MNTKNQRIVVVGGGIVGTACAHYLRQNGADVTIIERGIFGKACSHANCGLICPSHALPLAEPGAVRSALATMFRANSPLRIQWRWDPALYAWLVRFARRCNEADMMLAAGGRHELLRSSRQLFDQLFRDHPLPCEWEPRGLLHVYRSPHKMDAYAKTDALLTQHFGLSATPYDRDQVVELEPALRADVAGGWHYEMDAHLRPDRLLDSWRQLLERQNVVIQEGNAVCEFQRRGSSRVAEAVVTQQGDVAADAIVVAAGALTPHLSKPLGCPVPIQPGKGYSITTSRPARCPTIPLIFPEHRVAVTPMQTGYRLGSTMEFCGYDSSINDQRLSLLCDGAQNYLDEPSGETVLEKWFGWRPMTFDGLPIIGRSPAFDNVWIAAGHSMLGLSMAPATGKLVAEQVFGSKPHIDPQPYRVDRF